MYTTEQFNADAATLLDLIQKCVEQEQLNEESWHKKNDEVIAMHYDNYESRYVRLRRRRICKLRYMDQTKIIKSLLSGV